MTRVLKKLKKLRGRSLREMRVRGRQALAAFNERRGWSEQAAVPETKRFLKRMSAEFNVSAEPSAESLLENFRTRREPHFFAPFDNREETLSYLRSLLQPDAVQSIISRA